jgi:hypothetical protein
MLIFFRNFENKAGGKSDGNWKTAIKAGIATLRSKLVKLCIQLKIHANAEPAEKKPGRRKKIPWK